MTPYPATDYPTQADLEQLQRLFPHDQGIQNITLPALIAEIKTLDMDTLPPVANHRVPRAVLTPCELAVASLVLECIFTVFDVGLVGQTGVDNAVSDNVLNAIGPRLGEKLNLLGRLAHVVSAADSSKVAKAIAVVRIVFLVEALGLIATILEEVIKGFSLLTGAFFALKTLSKMILALATDGTSLILGSIALLLTDTSNIIIKATAVSTPCGTNAAPIAAPVTGGGAPVSPQSPFVPYAIAVDSHGTLYASDYDNDNAQIQTFAPNATAGVTIIRGNAGGGAPNPADPARASALAVAADGTLYTINRYLSSLPNSVYKWAPGAPTPVIIGTGLSGPQGIALGPRGHVYVVDGYPRVVRFDASGPPDSVGVTVAGVGAGRGPLANQFDGATAIAVDGSHNLYICDTNNHRVQKWAPGATTGQTVAGGHGQGSGANQLNQPTGIALDPAGNIYVSDSGNARVQIWEPNVGVGVPVAGGQGQGSEVDQLNWPRDIVRRGNTLYVADTGNLRVMTWDLG